jgi:hypothetical protein
MHGGLRPTSRRSMRLGPPPAAGYATTEGYRVTLWSGHVPSRANGGSSPAGTTGCPFCSLSGVIRSAQIGASASRSRPAPRPGPPARDRPDPAEPVTHPSGAPWHAGSHNTDAPITPNVTAASLTATPASTRALSRSPKRTQSGGLPLAAASFNPGPAHSVTRCLLGAVRLSGVTRLFGPLLRAEPPPTTANGR